MVRMRDVAQALGVSTMTVSNAFSRPDQLSPELRERILTAAARMGYEPRRTQGPGARGPWNAYGVVYGGQLHESLTNAYFTQWLLGFTRAMDTRGAGVLLLSASDGDASASFAVRHAPVDGLASPSGVHALLRTIRTQGLPVVTDDPSDECFVAIDDRAAGRAAADLLVSLGHDRVWVLTGPVHGRTPPAAHVFTMEKSASFLRRWPRLAGITETVPRPRIDVACATGWAPEDGQDAARLILDRHDRPSAVVAMSDALAFGLLQAMHDRGLAPGRDVSVVGFDDLDGAATLGLTTVRQPSEEKGRRAGELLLDPRLTPRQITLAHELIVRSSTGPAPRP